VRFSKANPISVYVATAQGLFESRDEGITWNRLLTDSRAVDRVTLHPVDPNWLAIQTSSQVYVSEDRGKTWLETRIGGASTRVYDFAFRSSTSRTILAGTSHGLFQSDDAGRTWEPKSSGTPIIPLSQFFRSSQRPTDVYFFSHQENQIYVSEDEGGQWRRFDDGSLKDLSIQSMATNPAVPGSFLALTANEGVVLYKSASVAGIRESNIANKGQ